MLSPLIVHTEGVVVVRTTVNPDEAVAPEAPLASGALQGTNITGKAQYQGPCAGPGSPHHYTFELQALDQKLDLPQGATRDQIQDAAKGHVLGSTVYIGLFNR